MRPSYQWGPPEGYGVFQSADLRWYWHRKPAKLQQAWLNGVAHEPNMNGPYPTKQAAISNCRKIVAAERAKEKVNG